MASEAKAEAGTAFVLLLDAPSLPGVAQRYAELLGELGHDVAGVLGFTPVLDWLPLPAQGQRMGRPLPDATGDMAERVLGRLAAGGARRFYLLPASFDFGVQQKQWLTELVRGLTRAHPELSIHYDRMTAAHPLVLQALVDQACRTLSEMQVRSPGELGVLLIASGSGDPDTRADSYRLMRLVWEQLGASRGDVGFVRHPHLPLPEQFAACARSGLTWLCLPQFLWPAEQLEYARVIFGDAALEFDVPGWRLGEALGSHPNVRAWLAQRMLSLHREHRSRVEQRARSLKHAPAPAGRVYGSEGSVALDAWDAKNPRSRFGQAVLARIAGADELRRVLAGFALEGERCLVKPTWHGYATGTYTDSLALDWLLSALPCRGLLVEGHTASRNVGRADFDWERDACEHRLWIREQEQQYLQKTGLREIMGRHRASYVNVTECWWDGRSADAEIVRQTLAERGVELSFPELYGYVPQVLFDQRGATMLSFARFKGPTRLSISNLFGLLPQVLRTAWHGPSILHFARVCCDLAKLYGTLFRLIGVVESFSHAVRWERSGLYRSRWGNYDLIEAPGVVCVSAGLASADVLAARLQGQDVRRSAFFDVVREELGFDEALASVELSDELVQRFC